MKELEGERIASANEVLEYLTAVMRGKKKDQFGLDASLKDRNKAAELLGKKHILFTDRVENTKEPITVVINGADKLED